MRSCMLICDVWPYKDDKFLRVNAAPSKTTISVKKYRRFTRTQFLRCVQWRCCTCSALAGL